MQVKRLARGRGKKNVMSAATKAKIRATRVGITRVANFAQLVRRFSQGYSEDPSQRCSVRWIYLPSQLIEPLLENDPRSSGRWNRQEAQMARYFRIRCIVKTDRTEAHERIQAICGLMADGSHWTLTQEDAVSQVENGISAFYIERPRGQRYDVAVAMDGHAHRYLKTADRDQPDQLMFLPACPHVVHTAYSVAGQPVVGGKPHLAA